MRNQDISSIIIGVTAGCLIGGLVMIAHKLIT